MMRKFISIGAMLLVLAATGCGGIRGSGENVSETRQITTPFDGIELRGSGDLTVSIGEEVSVIVETDSELIDRVTTTVGNGWLVVDVETNRLFDIDTIRVDITVPSLEGLALTGSGSITAAGLNESLAIEVDGSGQLTLAGEVEGLEIELDGSGSVDATGLAVGSMVIRGDGSGDIDVAVDGPLIDAVVDGSMTIAVQGAVDRAMITISGSGEFLGRDLTAGVADIDISGDGDVTISVDDQLNVYLSGSGDVIYQGTPEVLADISGSGSVQRG